MEGMHVAGEVADVHCAVRSDNSVAVASKGFDERPEVTVLGIEP
jgi:hypothetical protein